MRPIVVALRDAYPFLTQTDDPISFRRLPNRVRSGLVYRGVATWNQLADRTVAWLMRLRNFGPGAIRSLVDELERLQLAADGPRVSREVTPVEPAISAGVQAALNERLAATRLATAATSLHAAATTVRFADAYPLLASLRQVIDVSSLTTRAITTLNRRRVRVWADLADETVDSLLTVRQTGEGTVMSIVDELERLHDRLERDLLQSADEPLGDIRVTANDPAREIVDLPAPDLFGVIGQSLSRDLRLVCDWCRAVGLAPAMVSDLLQADERMMPPDVVDARARVLSQPLPSETEGDRDGAAVISSLLDSLDERGRQILHDRYWTEPAKTLAEIGNELGITRERVRQLAGTARGELAGLVAVHKQVRWLVHDVRRRLGRLAPTALVRDVLDGHGIEPPSTEARVLLDLAGPYRLAGPGWRYNVADDPRLAISASIAEAVAGLEAPTHAQLVELFGRHGVSSGIADAFMPTVPGIRRFGDHWWRWGGSVSDKAAVVLLVATAPRTAAEINAEIGEGHSERGLAGSLSADPRFVRTSRQHWGLRDWDLEEYSGIAEEIIERIIRDGGWCDIEALVSELVSTFGTSEGSIRSYLSTMAFVIDGGRVRLRTGDDIVDVDTSLGSAKGVYRQRDGSLRVVVPVTRETLRGSGQQTHTAVAHALGLHPGDPRRFIDAECTDTVLVTWRLTSTSGPDIGSLRRPAERIGCRVGGVLLVDFDRATGTFRVSGVDGEVDGVERLAAIVGIDPARDLEAQLAGALECERSEIRSTLRRRGDDEIAGLIPSTIDPSLQDALEGLVGKLT